MALIYNWWSWYARLAHPATRLEAITSRPLLLAGVARLTEHAGQSRLLLTSTLSEAVAVFKLQQGSADEALSLVEQAVVYLSQCGSRDAFLRGLTQVGNGFFDRDMYIFALDKRGTYLAFGGNPAKVGTRVQDIAGIDGDGLVDAIITQASHEPGWVEYDITNPTTGRMQTKIRLPDPPQAECSTNRNWPGTLWEWRKPRIRALRRSHSEQCVTSVHS